MISSIHQIIILIALIWSSSSPSIKAADDPMLNLLNKNTTEIIRLRGYLAEDHFIVTVGGYILNLVRATNPLINEGRSGLANRSVVFFLHGALTNAKCFIVDSLGASPRDLSSYNISEMSDQEAFQLLGDQGSANSLVFTLLDLGHEVWLLNRRGNYYSQGNIYPEKQPHLGQLTAENISDSLQKVQDSLENITYSQIGSDSLPSRVLSNLPSGPMFSISDLAFIPNPKYWDFSTDEQAIFDLPAAIDYVREFTGRLRLAFVGHSTGAAIVLQALSLNETLNEKFTKLLIWAPALDLKAGKQRSLPLSIAGALLIPLQLYYGDIPPHVLVPLIQDLAGILCAEELTDELICYALFEILFGPGAEQNKVVSGDLTAFPDVLASHELAQLAQWTTMDKSAMYDYGIPAVNLYKYGKLTPPLYDLSKITTNNIKIYLSEADTLVPSQAVYRVMSDLVVPYESTLFNAAQYYPQLKFNHGSYLLHRNITRLLVIPSARDIQSAGAE